MKLIEVEVFDKFDNTVTIELECKHVDEEADTDTKGGWEAHKIVNAWVNISGTFTPEQIIELDIDNMTISMDVIDAVNERLN